MNIAKNVYEKRILVVIVILIFLFSGVATGYVVQDFGNGNNLVKSVGIASDYGQAWGFNATGKKPTWEIGTVTLSGNTAKITFAVGFNVTNIVVFQKNDRYDVQGLLNSSLYFNTMNVKLALVNETGISEKNDFSLSYAAMDFGIQTNDTSLHAISDKAVSGVSLYGSQTVYSSTVNQLNKSTALSVFGLATSNFNDKATIQINLKSTGIGAKDKVIVDLTQSFGAPYNTNLINVFVAVMSVMMLLAVGLMFMGMPRIGRK